MKLEDIAKAYTDCIELEEKILQECPSLAQDMSILRADLHALLMSALHQARIPFTDRTHAAKLAYDILQGKLKTA
jgi:hypothetical protein